MKQAKLNTLEDYYCRVVKEITFNNNIGSIIHTTSDYIESTILPPTLLENRIIGKVMYVDNFGNIITNICKKILKHYDANKQIRY